MRAVTQALLPCDADQIDTTITGEDGSSDAHDDEAAYLLLGHASTTFGNDGTSVPSTTSTTPTSDHFVDQYARYNVVRCNEFANT